MIEENLASEAVVALPGADASAVAWREAGQLFITVIAKASFSLSPGAVMARCEPQPILGAELHYGNNPVRSVRFTPDLAPRLARAEVLFTGHGHAPAAAPAVIGAARLALFAGERPVLDKTILLQDPRGFQRIPLVYERAFGGSTVLENPLGVGGDADGGEPNLVDIVAPRRPIGFGPIARAWPARKRLLGKTQRSVLEGPIAEVPVGFDWSYFQSAPRDQQIDSLRGDETIALFGLHPAHPVLITRLPGVRGTARLYHLTRTGIPDGRVFDLKVDTLRIDGDEERCTVVCRGVLQIAMEAVIPEMLILAGIEVAGEALVWPDPLPTRRSRPAIARSAESVRAGTVLDTRAPSSPPIAPRAAPSFGVPPLTPPVPTHLLGDAEDEQECETKKRKAVPFEISSPESARPFTASPAPPPVTTLLLGPDEALPPSGVALPFPQAPPTLPEPHPARGGSIPGAPWSSKPTASALFIDPGEMTVDSPDSAASIARRSSPAANTAVAPVAPVVSVAPAAPVAPVAPIAPGVSGDSGPQSDESAPPPSRFFHDLRRINEVDSAAPLEPEAEVTLARCAKITVELAEQRASRIATLEAHGLDNARWTAAERGWLSAMEDEAKSGGHALRDAFDAAYIAAWETIRGALKVPEYARLVVAVETGKIGQALDALSIRRTVWTRMTRCWDRRMALDARLTAEVEREIAALRGA